MLDGLHVSGVASQVVADGARLMATWLIAECCWVWG